MSVRSLAVAGPSRLSSRVSPRGLQLPVTPTAQRRNFTWPSPDHDPSRGTLHLHVTVPYRIPSTLHVFAIMREVERRFGPVAALDAPMDPASKQYGTGVTFTMYTPVGLERPDVLEVPQPTMSADSNVYGGASFDDIEALLGGSRRLKASSSGPGGADEAGAEPLVCTVERASPDSLSKYTPSLKTWVSKGFGRQVAEVAWRRKEEADIAHTLVRIGEGYHGGFNGLADQWAHLRDTLDEQYGKEEYVPEGGAVGPNGALLSPEQLEGMREERVQRVVSAEPAIGSEIDELRGWRPATGRQRSYPTPEGLKMPALPSYPTPEGLKMPALPSRGARPSGPTATTNPPVRLSTSSESSSRTRPKLLHDVRDGADKWALDGGGGGGGGGARKALDAASPRLTGQMRAALELARKRIAAAEAAEREEAVREAAAKDEPRPGRREPGWVQREGRQAAVGGGRQGDAPGRRESGGPVSDPEQDAEEKRAAWRARMDSAEAYESMRRSPRMEQWEAWEDWERLQGQGQGMWSAVPDQAGAGAQRGEGAEAPSAPSAAPEEMEMPSESLQQRRRNKSRA